MSELNYIIEMLELKDENISNYMKISIKALNKFKIDINNTFSTNYHNGFVEENNNFIKVLKRIAF